MKKFTKNFKKNYKYILIILITLIVGVVGTLFSLKYLGYIDSRVIEKTVSNITLSETDTIKSSVNKIYNSAIYLESYKNNTATGSGSGFIYKKDSKYGYILTNYHVIDESDTIEVTNMNGEECQATLLGGDEYTDIAVLRIDVKYALQAAELGSSESAELGDTIFTVGSPLGKTYMGSVTKGILSGKNRMVTVSNQYTMSVLQVDAALNPGNSGGPLVNINGEVIGITSMKFVQDEIEGMGFAIPIELVKEYLNDLELGNEISRPILGVSVLDAASKYALYTYEIIIDSEVKDGVAVVEVQKDSPAEVSGFKKGDVLLAINGEHTGNVADFRSALYKYKVGDTISIDFYRDGNIKTTKVKLNASLKNS